MEIGKETIILGESEDGIFNFDHHLGTNDVIIAVYTNLGTYRKEYNYSVTATSMHLNLQRINVKFGEFKVVIIG